MGQMTFLSAEACHPKVADLAGLLCGAGQMVGFGRGTAARVWVVTGERWRAGALRALLRERGVQADVSVTEEGEFRVQSAFQRDLTGLAACWLSDGAKSVPPDFELDGHKLRFWALACGRHVPGGYLLGLDPAAPQTYEGLQAALQRVGQPAKVLAPRGGGPGLRIAGARRLARLADLVGPIPVGVEQEMWPAA
ncbi:hypothetical protein D5S17_13230 [Pseudonocardiaceae bacterium YIM PH 21723]|nr:hypothetical protein D5S17_13230 [Pseudonocardiaceae bacterium YIM PH 21723]